MTWHFLSVWIDAFPHLLSGLFISLQLCLLALLFGLPGGLALAMLQIVGNRPTRFLVIIAVELVRGAPLLVVLYLFYFGLPQVGMSVGAFVCAVAGLGVSTAAYTSEIFRAALTAVPHTMHEASDSIGLGGLDKYRFVVLPMAIRIAIAPLLVFCVILFQGTSLCFAISVPEMLSKAYNYSTVTFEYLPTLTLAGLIYAAIAIPTSRLVSRIEVRLNRH
jgi:polar amino acid transport system permease protein